jgi:hypothetical protein
MLITVCSEPMDYPAEIGQMPDSSGLLGDPAALRARMAEDGYLFLRGFHPRQEVLAARARIQEKMKELGIQTGQHRQMQAAAALPEVLALLEAPRLFAFFGAFFGEPALTFDEKWLRAVGHGEFTGLHYDNVYMGRGSARLHTVWTPLGDLPLEMGTLAVCAGSHLEPFRELQETYGRQDVDRDPVRNGGWYSNNPREVSARFGGRWVTSPVQAGDAIVFPMFTLHGSTQNTTRNIRMSCDTRFQPAADPADERWAGAARAGHTPYGAA